VTAPQAASSFMAALRRSMPAADAGIFLPYFIAEKV
jgi:hypothetical protein